jgi:quercetin dioxygenase-like cupin family protein
MKMNGKLIALLVATAGTVTLAVPSHAADKPKKSGGAVFAPAADIKWGDVPGMTGVQLAPVDGDPGKGPSHFFLKFAGGFAAPIHHHSANHFGTVVSGTLVLTVDGSEQKLPAGSFFGFSGKTKHATRCEAGADCVLSMDVRGKWDVVVATDKAGAKK